MTPITVVTGANSGIGRATALHLAEHGHAVFGIVRSVARAGMLLDAADERGVGVEVVELDIADDRSVRDGFAGIVERAGRVDHLVNNAGVRGNAVVEEMTSDRLLDVVNVDVMGAVRCAQAVLPQMRERGAGTIVNVTSVAGRIGAIAQAPYVAAKWALEGLSEQLAIEVAPFGLRVAIIEPGVTKSSIFGEEHRCTERDRRLRRAVRPDAPDVRRRLPPRLGRRRGGRGHPDGDRDRRPPAEIPGELGWRGHHGRPGGDDRRGVSSHGQHRVPKRLHRRVRPSVRDRHHILTARPDGATWRGNLTRCVPTGRDLG